MSCDLYLTTLKAFADALAVADHPNIKAPLRVGIAIGSTGGVQSDEGTLNLRKAGVKPATGVGGSPSYFPEVGDLPASIYTAYRTNSEWQEQWVIRDKGSFAPTGGHLIWTQLSGDTLGVPEQEALCAEQTASGKQYSYADMVFQYRKLLNATQVPPTLSPGTCLITATHYFLWPVLNGVRQGMHPSGALLRESLSNGTWVDHWILKGEYLPPSGTREVVFEAKGKWTTGARDWLMKHRFPVPVDAGPLGPLGVLENLRYVQIPYGITSLPFCP